MTWIAAKFAGGFVEKAGADTWDAFRHGGWRGITRLISEIAKARDGRKGTTTIRDPTGPDVHLTMDIPDHAVQDLANLDWEAMSDGWLTWDAERQEWRFLHGHRAPQGATAPRL